MERRRFLIDELRKALGFEGPCHKVFTERDDGLFYQMNSPIGKSREDCIKFSPNCTRVFVIHRSEISDGLNEVRQLKH